MVLISRQANAILASIEQQVCIPMNLDSSLPFDDKNVFPTLIFCRIYKYWHFQFHTFFDANKRGFQKKLKLCMRLSVLCEVRHQLCIPMKWNSTCHSRKMAIKVFLGGWLVPAKHCAQLQLSNWQKIFYHFAQFETLKHGSLGSSKISIILTELPQTGLELNQMADFQWFADPAFIFLKHTNQYCFII